MLDLTHILEKASFATPEDRMETEARILALIEAPKNGFNTIAGKEDDQ